MKFTSLPPSASALWTQLLQQILSSPCPHCSKQGSLRRHGFLRGKDLRHPSTIKRGLRFFCSNRFNNNGCARTFSLFFDASIPRYSLSSQDLDEFLRKVLQASSIHAAWAQMKLPFSISSAYRWIKSLKRNMARVRPLLHESQCKAHGSTSVLQETIRLLLKSFPLNPIARFQTTFQTPIFL